MAADMRQAVKDGAGERTIRNARIEDSQPIAEILAEAFPSLYRGTFGKLSHAETVSLLAALYRAGHLSFTDTRLVERQGTIEGVMILHIGLPIGRGSAVQYGRLLRRHLGLFRAFRAFFGGVAANYMLEKRIPHAEDLVYIEALAVRAASRGQGIGSLLLSDAGLWARQQKRSRLALHVLNSNIGARRLYERVGFRPWQSSPSAPSWLPRFSRPASWGATLMLRQL
jgi:ribosomal protein S18 acetylase RimI-like enzyme